MSNAPFLPSHFGVPFLTTLPEVRYDNKGRQMAFVESEVQRLERVAFVNASKSRSNSPTQSLRSSASSPAPSIKLISEPFGDPIELMANRLANEYMSSDESSSSGSDDDFYSVPKSSKTRRAIHKDNGFQPGHRRKRSSLSSIPEED